VGADVDLSCGWGWGPGRSRCSTLIKLTPGADDVIMAHGTWDTYSSSWPRIMKKYSRYVSAVQGGARIPGMADNRRPDWDVMVGVGVVAVVVVMMMFGVR
jgi:hypothetical protein